MFPVDEYTHHEQTLASRARQRKIVSALMIAGMVIVLLPFNALLACFGSISIGNFAIYLDRQKFWEFFDCVWINPVQKMIERGGWT